MTAIIDYGVGNLFSLEGSLKHIGQDCVITSDEAVLRKADRIILPGVGAFPDAIKKLESTGLVPVIKELAEVKPIMGICLGMQLLFDESHEYGTHKGLGLIKGKVVPIESQISEPLKVPHMGWNSLNIKKTGGILKYVNENEFVYYVHSFCAVECDESVTASSYYGTDITGSVQKNNVYGTQFHPEKSGETGLKILKAFCEL